MSHLYRCISVSLLVCILTLAMFNCGGIEGEKLELPLGEWVLVTSTKVPYHIRFVVMKDSLLYFTVITTSPQDEDRYKSHSNCEARVGEILPFGRMLIHFQDPSQTKSTTYFDAKVIEFDSESNVATIVVLPEKMNQ